MQSKENGGIREYLFGHYNEETAYLIEDYPYGRRKRCQKKVWLETDPQGKKGDRFVSRTQNPDSKRWNAEKKSTYSNIGVLFKDEKGHIHWTAITIYDSREKVKAFVENIGGVEKLNEGQTIMYNSLMGIDHTVRDGYGNEEKPYRYDWIKYGDKLSELKITFNRPDRVSHIEIFEAMKKANQDKLNTVYDNKGNVRICVRGGVLLKFVNQAEYKAYLASDTSQEQDNKEEG